MLQLKQHEGNLKVFFIGQRKSKKSTGKQLYIFIGQKYKYKYKYRVKLNTKLRSS